MTNIEIKQLFKYNRLPENEFKLICLLLYLPIGIVLFILRTILVMGAIIIGYSLADSSLIHKLINKIACLSLGISITVENPEKKENVDVYVSNSVSIFDQLVAHSTTRSVSPGSKMNPAISKGLGLHYFGTLSNLDTLKTNILSLISENKIPVYFTPEGKITNGKALLKFKTYPFSLTTKVQPVCLNIERPFLDISVCNLGSTYFSDLLWYMFSPLTNYRLKFLPSVEKNSLSDEEFAEIVRRSIAIALKIEKCDFSAEDLAEWEKRELTEQQRPQLVMPRSDSFQYNPEVRRMASQVKEVLPHVPLDVIFKDLSRTKNVDNTITNVLEGRVQFIPETQESKIVTPQASTSSLIRPSTSSSDRDLFNTAADTFAKSAQDRTKSFQERKSQLIANARKRYIEKHNLDISD